MDTRYRNYDLDEDGLEVDRLSDHHPVYDDPNVYNEPMDKENNAKVQVGEYAETDYPTQDKDELGKTDPPTDEELNINPTPNYSSFEQIKKELVVLDLERQIAWEELLTVKHEFKEDVAPSNFVPPILGTVGVISGLVILKNLIFGK